ncbi:unnamed protein product, partial [Gulo gulo]
SLPSPPSPWSPLPLPLPLLRQQRPPGLGEELFLEEPRDAETSQWEEARRGDWHGGWEGQSAAPARLPALKGKSPQAEGSTWTPV